MTLQAALDSPTRVSKEQALALVTTNLEKLLGVEVHVNGADVVAYRGGDVFDMSSKVTAVISPRHSSVDLL